MVAMEVTVQGRVSGTKITLRVKSRVGVIKQKTKLVRVICQVQSGVTEFHNFMAAKIMHCTIIRTVARLQQCTSRCILFLLAQIVAKLEVFIQVACQY